MPSPGEIYNAEYPPGQQHPFLVISREELNRGKRVIAVNITSVDVENRAQYPNCVRLSAGEGGLTKDSVVQCENIVALNKARMDATPIGMLDYETMRNVLKALAYVFDAEFEQT